MSVFDVLLAIRNEVFKENYVRMEDRKIKILRNPVSYREPEIGFLELEKLRELEDKFNVQLLAVANKDTLSIEVSLNKPLFTPADFELDAKAHKEYVEMIGKSLIPIHKALAVVNAVRRSENENEYEELLNIELEIRTSAIKKQAEAVSIIRQKLQHLGVKHAHFAHPVVIGLRCPMHTIVVEDRKILISNLYFVLKDFADNHLRIRAIPRDFKWIIEVW